MRNMPNYAHSRSKTARRRNENNIVTENINYSESSAFLQAETLGKRHALRKLTDLS